MFANFNDCGKVPVLCISQEHLKSVIITCFLSILPSWFWCHHMFLLIHPFLYLLFILGLFCWHLLSCLAHKCGCGSIFEHTSFLITVLRWLCLVWDLWHRRASDPNLLLQCWPLPRTSGTHMTWRTDIPCPKGQTSQTRAVESSALPPPLDVFHLGSSSDWTKDLDTILLSPLTPASNSFQVLLLLPLNHTSLNLYYYNSGQAKLLQELNWFSYSTFGPW